MSRALIRIKKEPEKPKRLKNAELKRIMLRDKLSLADLNKIFDDYNSDEVRISGYYMLVYGPEPDSTYNKKLQRYEEALRKYQRWYTENEKLILAELERRREKEEEAKQKRELAQEKYRTKRIEILKKELEKLELKNQPK